MCKEAVETFRDEGVDICWIFVASTSSLGFAIFSLGDANSSDILDESLALFEGAV